MRIKFVFPVIAFIVIFLVHASYTAYQASMTSRRWVQLADTSWLSLYLQGRDYFLGMSYALAAAFAVYALMMFLAKRKKGAVGVIGGVTFTGILYGGACFLTGCCGSPMIALYVGLFGPSFLGVTKPLTLGITAASVAIGFVWLRRKEDASTDCCCDDEKCRENTMDTMEGGKPSS